MTFSVSFRTGKSKIELKIAMKTWDILKYLFNCFVTYFEWKHDLFVWNKQIYQFETKTKG